MSTLTKEFFPVLKSSLTIPGNHPELLSELLEYKGTVTFVFSSKELELNNAVALKEYIGSLE